MLRIEKFRPSLPLKKSRQCYQFFRNKTWSWHFSGMVPNICIRKSMIARCLMPILVWFNENIFSTHQHARLISAVGANPGKSIKIRARIPFKHSLIDKISQKMGIWSQNWYLFIDLKMRKLRDRKLGLKTCLHDIFWSIHVRVPSQRWLWDGIFLGSQIPFPWDWDFLPRDGKSHKKATSGP